MMLSLANKRPVIPCPPGFAINVEHDFPKMLVRTTLVGGAAIGFSTSVFFFPLTVTVFSFI